MQIHRVKSGETLYSIAREYGVSPTKLIEINQLKNPEKLTVGRELLILFPKRTYTARRGDTLEAISKRFSVEKEDILKNNPSLYGSEKLYPEEILALGYCDEKRGVALIDGYLYNDTSRDRLSLIMPYLSSLTVSSLLLEGGKLRRLFNFSSRELHNLGKRVSQRVYCPAPHSELLPEEKVISSLTKAIKADNRDAITLALSGRMNENTIKFIKMLGESAKESEISLYLECGSEIPEDLSTLFDRFIITDSAKLDSAFYQIFAERHGANKTMMDISPFAMLGYKPIPINEALLLADANMIELERSEDGNMLIGKVREKELTIPSLESIKAKLDLIGELGLLGASVDIMRCPLTVIMMLSSLYEINPSYFSGGM